MHTLLSVRNENKISTTPYLTYLCGLNLDKFLDCLGRFARIVMTIIVLSMLGTYISCIRVTFLS